MRTWTAAQAAAFLTATAEDRLYAAWVLALVRGLRRGELAGLRWADVDLDQRTIGIVSQRTTDADWNVIIKAPKGTSRRTIDLGGAAVAALHRHQQQSSSERQHWGSAYTDTGLVFVQEDGSPYHPARLSDTFQRSARHAGLPPIRLHDARHSCATLALARASTPRSFSNCSATPPGQRPWTCTPTASNDSSVTPPRALRTRCSQRVIHLGNRRTSNHSTFRDLADGQ